jgi:hypothetical protein
MNRIIPTEMGLHCYHICQPDPLCHHHFYRILDLCDIFIFRFMMPLVHFAIEIAVYLNYLCCEWGYVQAEEKEADRYKKFDQTH